MCILTCELIFHHLNNHTAPLLLGGQYLIDQYSTGGRVCSHQRLLAYVRSEFVPSHLEHLAAELADDEGLVLRVTMLEYKLNDIVLEEYQQRIEKGTRLRLHRIGLASG